MLATPDLHGIRVLVIEDEPIIGLMFEDVLLELGCRVVGPASNLQQAFDIVHSADGIDVAILDVKLGKQSVYPIARELADRGIPLVFSTGMGAEGLPPEWRGCSAIPKPATIRTVAEGLRQALGSRAPTADQVATGMLAAAPMPCGGND
jgi:CheY-like chemotaxis protein